MGQRLGAIFDQTQNPAPLCMQPVIPGLTIQPHLACVSSLYAAVFYADALLAQELEDWVPGPVKLLPDE